MFSSGPINPSDRYSKAVNTFMLFRSETVSVIFASNIVANTEGNGDMLGLPVIVLAQFIVFEMLCWDVIIVVRIKAAE